MKIMFFLHSIGVDAFILLIPAIDSNLLELIKSNSTIPVLSGMVLIGKNDSFYNNTKQLLDFLESRKLKIEKYIYPDLGHSYPEEYKEDLLSFLEKIRIT